MTEPTLDDVEPIYVRMEPCIGDNGQPHFTDSHGICNRCKLACGYVTSDRGYRHAKPHQRPVPVYAMAECAECSCGGWLGTPVSMERQTDGSEELLLSFQGRVDDIEKNQANLVDQVLLMNEKLDRLLGGH